jgi:hypothetical protein
MKAFPPIKNKLKIVVALDWSPSYLVPVMSNTTTENGNGQSADREVKFSRIQVAAIRAGLRARQAGMFITSPAKGGGTKNLLSLLSEITGLPYVSGKRGIEEGIRHCTELLAVTEDSFSKC